MGWDDDVTYLRCYRSSKLQNLLKCSVVKLYQNSPSLPADANLFRMPGTKFYNKIGCLYRRYIGQECVGVFLSVRSQYTEKIVYHKNRVVHVWILNRLQKIKILSSENNQAKLDARQIHWQASPVINGCRTFTILYTA